MDKVIFTSTSELAALVRDSVFRAFREQEGKPKEVEKAISHN